MILLLKGKIYLCYFINRHYLDEIEFNIVFKSQIYAHRDSQNKLISKFGKQFIFLSLLDLQIQSCYLSNRYSDNYFLVNNNLILLSAQNKLVDAYATKKEKLC
jgi:hypothetical protein